ncbi:MAG: Mut7-C RNAse domain-containing protein [Myxococcota bacterium]
MAVPCPRCRREYDVTLFEFGRTLWCTCGSRVGLAPRERRHTRSERRFIADAMLGRLARWLRLLGFDCAWEPDISDQVLVRRAIAEGRIVLSRDRALPEEWRISGIHQVDAKKVRDQLSEVVSAFDLAPEIRLLSRCSHCNAPLAPAAFRDVVERVPQRVLERHDVFSTCPACSRVYWEGTHTARIKRFVDELVARLEAATPGPPS